MSGPRHSRRLGRVLAGASAVGFAWGAWLAAPLHDVPSGRPLSVAIFDRSASVERTRPDFEAWLSRAAETERARALAEDSDFAALVFAQGRAWWLPPGDPRRSLGPCPRAGDPLGSDLAAALELARSAAAESGAAGGSVRIHSDARATGEGVDGPLRALARAGWSVERAELPAPILDDIALSALWTPERLEEGAPLACEIRAETAFGRNPDGTPRDVARRLRIEIVLRGAGEPRRLEFERRLEADQERIQLRFDLGTAPQAGVALAVRLRLDGDPIPENDSAAAWVDVGGSLLIAVVAPPRESPGATGEAAGVAFAADAARWPGLSFLPTRVEDLPAALSHVQAVLTLDVDASGFPGGLMRAFLEAGGGWLDCSGFAALRALPAGAEAPAGARDLLPLVPRAPERAPRDVLLLIDGSGSMAGEAHEGVRGAALELARAVPLQDRLLLAFFTRRLEEPRVLRDANAADFDAIDLAALLRARAPSGGTDVLGALAELALSKQGESRPTLALLLSDGRDPTAGERRDRAKLRAQLAAARIELAAFAFGPDADTAFLSSLLPPGAELARVDDPRQLGELFRRAVDAERLKQPTQLIASDAGSFPEGSMSRDLAQALAPAAPASIERSWIAEENLASGVLWRSAAGDPLLALRAHGRGFAAALASLPAEGWAAAAREPAVLGPLLRGLARQAPMHSPLPRASLERGKLWIRGLASPAPATIVAALPGGFELILAPPTDLADAPLSTRVASFPPERAAELALHRGTALLDLRTPGGDSLGSVTLAPAPLAEFAAQPIRIADPAARVEPGAADERRPRAHPAAPWILVGALGLISAALLLGLRTR